MRPIQLFFAGVELGPFSQEQVQRYLGEGFLSPSDLAKYEEDSKWVPLEEILVKPSRRSTMVAAPVKSHPQVEPPPVVSRTANTLPIAGSESLPLKPQSPQVEPLPGVSRTANTLLIAGSGSLPLVQAKPQPPQVEPPPGISRTANTLLIAGSGSLPRVPVKAQTPQLEPPSIVLRAVNALKAVGPGPLPPKLVQRQKRPPRLTFIK